MQAKSLTTRNMVYLPRKLTDAELHSLEVMGYQQADYQAPEDTLTSEHWYMFENTEGKAESELLALLADIPD